MAGTGRAAISTELGKCEPVYSPLAVILVFNVCLFAPSFYFRLDALMLNIT